MENIVNKNKVLGEYFGMFDKSEWDEVGERLMEYAIKCIMEGNGNDYENVETVQSNKQKFTVKKESKGGNGNASGNSNTKGKVSGSNNCKLFTVSINKIVNESENKKNNSLFTLDNKLSSLSRQLQSVNNYCQHSKHYKFNVEHTKH